MPAPGPRPPALLVVTLLAFAAFLAVLVAQSLAPKHVVAFVPSPPAPRPADDGRSHPAPPGAVDTVTLDARDPDAWRFLDLDRAAVLTPPDTQGWDVAARRFRIIAGDGVADLGVVPFDSVTVAPSSGYLPTRLDGDTANPAIAHWYRYGFLSHVLRPRGRVYVVRTDAGNHVKLEMLSYYCPGPVAGCLTFRYARLR